MPISPLAAAYMTGQGGGGNDLAMLGMVDPALLQAQPELQLAQGMEQQGISDAPAYPGQAIARALQGVIGAGLQKSAISDLGRAYAGTPQTVAAILEKEQPNNPAIGLLKSNNPMAVMIGLQMAQKTIPIQAEGQRLGPNQVLVNGGPNPTAAGSPQLGGAAAAQEAAGRAPFEGGGTMVNQTPNGPQEVPITAATRAHLPYNQGGGPTPTAAIPPPQTTAVNPQRAPAPQMPAPPSPTGKDQSQVLQAAGLQGAPLPNPAIEPMVQADTEEVKADREKALAGQPDMANVRMIQDFLPKVQTGWGAETKLEGARILQGIGVPPDAIKDFLNTDVASGQILQKKFVELSAAAARTMGAREPGSVISMFSKAYPNLGTVPQAVVLQTNALYMDRERQMDLANAKTQYLNQSVGGVQSTGKYRGLTGFNEQFNQTNPPEAYLGAAEAMSGRPEVWARAKSSDQQDQITRLMPPNTKYLAPDGKWHMTPGGGAQQPAPVPGQQQ